MAIQFLLIRLPCNYILVGIKLVIRIHILLTGTVATLNTIIQLTHLWKQNQIVLYKMCFTGISGLLKMNMDIIKPPLHWNQKRFLSHFLVPGYMLLKIANLSATLFSTSSMSLALPRTVSSSSSSPSPPYLWYIS